MTRDLGRYKVADGEPDVRGWDVFDRDGVRIGTVEDHLVDPAAEPVHYLAVRLSPELSGSVAALGLATSSAVLGEPVGPFGLGTSPMAQVVPAMSASAETESRRILIPTRRAQLDPRDHRVTVDGPRSEIAALPEYGD